MAAIGNAPGWQPGLDLGGGVWMPAIGCGTQYGFTDDGHHRGDHAAADRYVAQALRQGFRLLDTARGYGTETGVRRGIELAGLDRRDVFVVTKAWPGSDHAPGVATSRAAIVESAARLGGYVDLFLVHQPVAGWQDLWRALEAAQDDGLVRAIGVSNFGVAQLEELARLKRRAPVANQIHLHPFVHRDRQDVVQWCQHHGVAILAYPRAPWRLGEGSAVDAIAASLGRTRAQVMLRWAIDRGCAVLPLSTSERHLAENFAVREFRLGPEQVAAIDRIGERTLRHCVDLLDGVMIAGWAFSGDGIARIQVMVDGRPVGEAAQGAPRPDVQSAHADAPGALASGFAFRFPEGCLAGAREVWLSFETRGGECIASERRPAPPPAGR